MVVSFLQYLKEGHYSDPEIAQHRINAKPDSNDLNERVNYGIASPSTIGVGNDYYGPTYFNRQIAAYDTTITKNELADDLPSNYKIGDFIKIYMPNPEPTETYPDDMYTLYGTIYAVQFSNSKLWYTVAIKLNGWNHPFSMLLNVPSEAIDGYGQGS